MNKPASPHKKFTSLETFLTQLQNTPTPVVVDFWADWCGPCHVIEPSLESLAREYGGEVEFWKVNADEHPEILSALRVRGIPTLVAFYNGVEMGRRTGAAPKPVLETVFRTALAGKVGGPGASDRRMRAWLALAFFVLALLGSFSPAVRLACAGMGGILLLWGYYDLLPFWPALYNRFLKK